MTLLLKNPIDLVGFICVHMIEMTIYVAPGTIYAISNRRTFHLFVP
jgi:hypothetical protein